MTVTNNTQVTQPDPNVSALNTNSVTDVDDRRTSPDDVVAALPQPASNPVVAQPPPETVVANNTANNVAIVAGGNPVQRPVLLAQATTFAPPTGADAAVRAALERAYRLPSYTPTPSPGGFGGQLARGGALIAAFLAGRYLTSEGELNLAKDTGQIPGYVGLRDMQDASVTMGIAQFDGSQAQNLTPDQKGRLIVGAAELERARSRGEINNEDAKRGFNELYQGIANPGTRPGQNQQQYGPTLEELTRGAQEQKQRNQTTPAAAPATPDTNVPETPGAPTRIGGVTADRVPYSEANLRQAITDAQHYNQISTDRVTLGYAVRDTKNGQWYVERISGISPTQARSLMWNLNQCGQLAHGTDDIFRSNGIGGWRAANGSTGTPEQDLKIREANAYFNQLTPQQVNTAAQRGALTVNGKTGTVYSPDSGNTLQQQITGTNGKPGANAADRGNVSLAIQRVYTIPGPNGSSRTVRGTELFTDLTPSEARSVLNQAAKNGTLWAPSGAGDAIDWNLQRNGLSRSGLDQRDAVIAQRNNPPAPQLPTLPEPTALPGGNDISRVASDYGLSPHDIARVMQENPGMSAEQAAQHIKGQLLNGPTGGSTAAPPRQPPNGTGATGTATGTGETDPSQPSVSFPDPNRPHASYPNAVPVTLDERGRFNGVENAGPNAPKFQKWIQEKGGSVYYDAASNTYIYANTINTSNNGRQYVEVAYRAGPPDGVVRPDFSPYATTEVPIPNMTGRSEGEIRPEAGDFSKAWRAYEDALVNRGMTREAARAYIQDTYGVRIRTTGDHAGEWENKGARGYTWHHHQDGQTMQLIDTLIHGTFTHTGGASLSR